MVFIFCFIFGLAFGLVLHRGSFPSTALQTPRLLVGRADHVPDGYAAPCSGTLHLGEIDTEFLGLLLGCMRGVRRLLILPAGGLLSLLGGLPCGLLTLLGSLSGGVLRLLSRTSGSILGLSRDLACLLGRLSSGFLGLPRCLTDGVLCLLDRSSCGLLGLSGYLSDLIRDPAQGSAALLLALLTPAGQAANGVLHLLGRSSCGLLCLTCNLACLLGRLSSGFLGLSGYLTGGVLRLLGHPLRDLLHLLLGLLDGLAHRVFHSHILGRLIHRILDLRVGVDHLLDLGLSVTGGKLLSVLLELLAVVLNLALYAAHRLPVETLGFLQVLILLRLLLAILHLFGHFVSSSLIPFTRR
jgi:hypothetical protein